MKKFSCAALLSISAAFLSCDGGGYTTSCKGVGVAAKGYEDHYPSCATSEKKFYDIVDTLTLYPPDFGNCANLHFTNPEDARACKDEEQKKVEEWRSEHEKRDLPISCVVSDGINSWSAWLTDEELAYLVETYGVSHTDGYKMGEEPRPCGK